MAEVWSVVAVAAHCCARYAGRRLTCPRCPAHLHHASHTPLPASLSQRTVLWGCRAGGWLVGRPKWRVGRLIQMQARFRGPLLGFASCFGSQESACGYVYARPKRDPPDVVPGGWGGATQGAKGCQHKSLHPQMTWSLVRGCRAVRKTKNHARSAASSSGRAGGPPLQRCARQHLRRQGEQPELLEAKRMR